MTEPPPMAPSAEERAWAESEANKLMRLSDDPEAQQDAIKTMLLATRHCAIQAIIAKLREPSDEMLRVVWEGYKVEGNWTFAISEALRALADHLEHQI